MLSQFRSQLIGQVQRVLATKHTNKTIQENQANKNGKFYFIFLISILYFERVHGPNHYMNGHEYILINKFNKCTFIFFGIARTMNDTHLFDKCRFTGLAGA